MITGQCKWTFDRAIFRFSAYGSMGSKYGPACFTYSTCWVNVWLQLVLTIVQSWQPIPRSHPQRPQISQETLIHGLYKVRTISTPVEEQTVTQAPAPSLCLLQLNTQTHHKSYRIFICLLVFLMSSKIYCFQHHEIQHMISTGWMIGVRFQRRNVGPQQNV